MCAFFVLKDEVIIQDGVIEADKQPSEIRQEPYPLQDQFEWSILDINQDAQVLTFLFFIMP
jgi:hypothetical protein